MYNKLKFKIINNDFNSFQEIIKLNKYLAWEKESELLLFAIKYKNINMVKILLDFGASPKVRNSLSLLVAIKNQDYNIVRLLLDYGANPSDKSSQSLMMAVKYNNYDIVNLLLDSGANINDQYNKPLAIAINNNNIKMINILINAGGEINESSFDLIIKNKNYNLINFFVNKGINTSKYLTNAINMNDPNIVYLLSSNEEYYYKHLENAISKGNINIVNIILDKCDPNNLNIISLFLKCIYNNDYRMFQKLLEFTNNFLPNPKMLFLIACITSPNIVNILIKNNNYCDNNIALILAILSGQVETCKILLELNHDYNLELALNIVIKANKGCIDLSIKKHISNNIYLILLEKLNSMSSFSKSSKYYSDIIEIIEKKYILKMEDIWLHHKNGFNKMFEEFESWKHMIINNDKDSKDKRCINMDNWACDGQFIAKLMLSKIKN